MGSKQLLVHHLLQTFIYIHTVLTIVLYLFSILVDKFCFSDSFSHYTEKEGASEWLCAAEPPAKLNHNTCNTLMARNTEENYYFPHFIAEKKPSY